MKKIFVLFTILAFGLTISAQKLVREDKVLTFTLDTLLVESETVSIDYYAKDFLVNARVQLQGDTADGTGTGTVALSAICYGSNNYENWFAFGDTLTLNATDGDSCTAVFQNIYYNYWRVKLTTTGTSQSTDVNYNILLDIND